MYNIFVIFTRHQESGKCNSTELHKIIEKIRPEIIFEELSYSNYDKAYKEKSLITLESNAIKKYLLEYNIEHIPVDTFDLPKNYHEKVDRLLGRLFHSVRIECRDLRNIVDDLETIISQKGFSFLNSDVNDEVQEIIVSQKEKILGILNDENLFQIARLDKEVIDKRENEILDNIYFFSKEHSYNQALLFIGSGHRKAMINKIEECKSQEETAINWKFYNE